MIVSGYTLDLYCDYIEHASYEEDANATFVGEHGSYCRRIARKAGWTLRRDGYCLCPKHKGETELKD